MPTVEAAYNGDKDKEYPFFQITGVGPSKTVYKQSDTFAVAPNPAFDITKEIFKGSSSSGNLVFAVDTADATGLIFYSNGDLIGGKDVYFATS